MAVIESLLWPDDSPHRVRHRDRRIACVLDDAGAADLTLRYAPSGLIAMVLDIVGEEMSRWCDRRVGARYDA